MASNLYNHLEVILKNELSVLGERQRQSQLFHAEAVYEIAKLICQKLKLSEEDSRLISIAAMLHDIKKYNLNGDRLEKHQEAGCKYLQENLERFLPSEFPPENQTQNQSQINLIGFMVLSHRKEEARRQASRYNLINNDLEKSIFMAEIVRGADLVSKVYRRSNGNSQDARRKIIDKINALENNRIVLLCLEEYVYRYFKIHE